MTKKLISLALVALLCSAAWAQVEVAKNSLLVKVEGEVANLPDGWVLEPAGQSGYSKLITGETETAQAIPFARAIRGITYVAANPIVYAQETVPNDPLFGQLWGMEKIQAKAAWDERRDSPDVVVAVIDTGIDFNHPDLQANIWTNPKEIPDNGVDDDNNGYVDDVHGWDFIAEDNDPSDDNNHGTHVSGTIGAVGNNGVGVVGVTWRVKIMPLKFLSASGGGTLADAIQAIDYASQMGTPISNNSWGGSAPRDFAGWQPLKEAIDMAGQKGMLFVASAGNSSTNNDVSEIVNLPASWELPSIISVAASSQDDSKAGFSSYGRTSVDLAAPGVSILSSVRGGGYQSFNGTSMAAPHVAGAAALLLGQDPGHADLKKTLMDSVDKSSTWQTLVASGGRLNVATALGQGPPPPPPPGNRPPVARDDHYETLRNRPRFVNVPGVLGNDTDPDGDKLSSKIVRQPSNGDIDMIPQGSFIYRPKLDFVGTDSFGYEASDGKLSDEADVVIQVLSDEPPPNKPPVGVPDEYTTLVGVAISGNVLENDSDPDGDPLVASLQKNSEHGHLSFDGRTGAFRYTPNPEFVGDDGFAYIAVDPRGGRSATVPVTFHVNREEEDDDKADRIIAILSDIVGMIRDIQTILRE